VSDIGEVALNFVLHALTHTRKQQMIIQNRELEELQNRIREAEQRLQSQQAGTNQASSGQQGERF